jgi:hypothetical protein
MPPKSRSTSLAVRRAQAFAVSHQPEDADMPPLTDAHDISGEATVNSVNIMQAVAVHTDPDLRAHTVAAFREVGEHIVRSDAACVTRTRETAQQAYEAGREACTSTAQAVAQQAYDAGREACTAAAQQALDASRQACATAARETADQTLAASRKACRTSARQAEDACAARQYELQAQLQPMLDKLQSQLSTVSSTISSQLAAVTSRIDAVESMTRAPPVPEPRPPLRQPSEPQPRYSERRADAGGAGGGLPPPPPQGARTRWHSDEDDDGYMPERPSYGRTEHYGPWAMQPATPAMEVPLDHETWYSAVGAGRIDPLTRAYETHIESVIASSVLRFSCKAALNAFILTFNTCVRMKMHPHQVQDLCDASLRVFLAHARVLQVYLAPRPKKLHEAFLPRAFAALLSTDMSVTHIDATLRNVAEQVGVVETWDQQRPRHAPPPPQPHLPRSTTRAPRTFRHGRSRDGHGPAPSAATRK